MAIAALQAGKHVYCEKPVGVTAAQVRALVAAAKGAQEVFVAGQQMRSYKQLGEAVRKIHEGVIGDVLMVKAQRHATADLNHDGSSGDWYFDVTKSGGYLIEQSVHNLDACNWAIGAHPAAAPAVSAASCCTRTTRRAAPSSTAAAHLRLSQRRQDVVHAERLSSPRHARRQPVHLRVRQQGRGGPAGDTIMYPLERRQALRRWRAKQEEKTARAHHGLLRLHHQGREAPADITIGATAALTAILGHEAMTKQKYVNWSDFKIDL